jgi:hypothetical protein
MLRIRVLQLALVLSSLPLLLVTGCSGGKAKTPLSGKLVLPNNAQLAESDTVQMVFVPEEKTEPSALAVVSNADLSFKTTQTAPGKYKIAVKIEPYPGDQKSGARAKQFEALNAKYDQAKTPLKYEVTSASGQTLTVDLNAGSVTGSKSN